MRNNGSTAPTSFLYGYDKTLPVAKIENATHSDAQQALSGTYNNLQTLTGQALRDELDGLRNALPNALVTSYTHNPLIGVESITDPKGLTVHYQYDAINRLQYIKDKDFNVLEEYRYNYRLEDLEGYLTSSATSMYLGQTISVNAFATGGTGNFSYEWTISNANLNQVITNAGASIQITATSDHAPSFTVTCVVTDTGTNESISLSDNITASQNLPPLTVSKIFVTPGGEVEVGDNLTYSINVSGGSGNYTYTWSKANGQGNTSYGTSTNASITKAVISYDCNNFTMSCTVNDVNSGLSITKQVTVNVDQGCSSGNQ